MPSPCVDQPPHEPTALLSSFLDSLRLAWSSLLFFLGFSSALDMFCVLLHLLFLKPCVSLRCLRLCDRRLRRAGVCRREPERRRDACREGERSPLERCPPVLTVPSASFQSKTRSRLNRSRAKRSRKRRRKHS